MHVRVCVRIFASNFTIISGDSRGYTCFWEGHHGTLMKVCTFFVTVILVTVEYIEIYCIG